MPMQLWPFRCCPKILRAKTRWPVWSSSGAWSGKPSRWAAADMPPPSSAMGTCGKGGLPSGRAKWSPHIPGGTVALDNLGRVLPPFVLDQLRGAMRGTPGRQIPGFDDGDTLFTGVETRTSSPVRLLRGEDLQATRCKGLIPCGEGAGYAGGIMSAAVDGIRAAQRILEEFRPLEG